MDLTAPATSTAYRSRRWLRRIGLRLRLRLVGALVLLVAVAGLAGLLLVRQALLDDLDARVDAGLGAQAAGFRAAAAAPPADLATVADRYLGTAAPGPDRAVLVFLDGSLHGTAGAQAGALAADPPLLRQWQEVPAGGYGTSNGTPAGQLRWLVVPLTADGVPRGQLVVTEATGTARAGVDRTVRTVAIGLGIVVVVTAAGGYLVVRRTLRPLRELTRTAGQLAGTGPAGRAAVDSDEVTALGQTFHALSERLERAFATQQAFLSDVGHELRTPLTIVRGHLELMGDDPDERRETVALVTDELDRMNRMVDDLLVLARAERPDFLHLAEVDVATVLQEVYAKAAALGDRDWQLGPVAAVTLRADRQRLTQALMQLVQNAVQFTGAGDRVALSARVEGDTLYLAVEDAGIGIAVEEQERIFARFGRAAGGRTRSEGAGLGLAIVAAIAAAHGGTVTVDSTPGGGSTFTLVLPRSGGEPLPEGGAAGTHLTGGRAAAGERGRTVGVRRA